MAATMRSEAQLAAERLSKGRRWVVVAVDESESSQVAFQYALQCLIRPHSDYLYIVHVCTQRRAPGSPAWGRVHPAWASCQDDSERSAGQTLRGLDESGSHSQESSWNPGWQVAPSGECQLATKDGPERTNSWGASEAWDWPRRERKGAGHSRQAGQDEFRRSKRLLETLGREADQMGIEHEVETLEAHDVGEAVVRKVEDVSADLLVIGGSINTAASIRTRGLPPTESHMSASEYCGRHSRCPVMIVRPSFPAKGVSLLVT